MKNQESNPASEKERAEGSRENVHRGANGSERGPDFEGADDFQRKTGLEGKTDSGPEPDVHGREIPPQE
jgi:hypothetical protein